MNTNTNQKVNECENEVSKTYEVKECQDKRLGDVAWWERRNKKDVVQEAFNQYLETKTDVPCKK
jgi:hypothetical protein